MVTEELLKQIRSLEEDQQIRLFRQLKAALYPSDESVLGPKLRETRHRDALTCPLCGATTVKRTGGYHTRLGDRRQRFLCKSCNHTFSDLTNSPMAGSHYLNRWTDYLECMVKGMSLRASAKAVGISLSTAFFWRHKIMAALGGPSTSTLSGILEADESYVLEARKGNRKITDRKVRNRGGVATKRGISRQQVCILAAVDRNGSIFSVVAGNGRIDNKQIAAAFGTSIEGITTLCTDSANSFKTFARVKKLQHEVINPSKRQYKRGIYHIQTVNSYHSRLKDWLRAFKGISTKYLNEYLAWHRFVDANRAVSHAYKQNALLVQAYKEPRNLICKQFRPCLESAS